jgi:hypothetical protein
MVLVKPPVNGILIDVGGARKGSYISASNMLDAGTYEFRDPFPRRIISLAWGGCDYLSHLICNPQLIFRIVTIESHRIHFLVTV